MPVGGGADLAGRIAPALDDGNAGVIGAVPPCGAPGFTQRIRSDGSSTSSSAAPGGGVPAKAGYATTHPVWMRDRQAGTLTKSPPRSEPCTTVTPPPGRIAET